MQNVFFFYFQVTKLLCKIGEGYIYINYMREYSFVLAGKERNSLATVRELKKKKTQIQYNN